MSDAVTTPLELVSNRYKLASIEPTLAMIEAAMNKCGPVGCCSIEQDHAREIWSAMLAASTPVGGWEDISTAPVIHGCEVDLWLETGERISDARGFQHNGVIVWHRLSDDGLHERIRAKATHWMFTPPPPSVSTDNGSRPQEAVPTEQAATAVVASVTLEGRQGEPAGMMTVTLHMSDGREVPIIRDNGNIISHWARVDAATLQPAEGRSSNEGAGE